MSGSTRSTRCRATNDTLKPRKTTKATGSAEETALGRRRVTRAAAARADKENNKTAIDDATRSITALSISGDKVTHKTPAQRRPRPAAKARKPLASMATNTASHPPAPLSTKPKGATTTKAKQTKGKVHLTPVTERSEADATANLTDDDLYVIPHKRKVPTVRRRLGSPGLNPADVDDGAAERRKMPTPPRRTHEAAKAR